MNLWKDLKYSEIHKDDTKDTLIDWPAQQLKANEESNAKRNESDTVYSAQIDTSRDDENSDNVSVVNYGSRGVDDYRYICGRECDQ
jgi:hypothetical protein